MARKGRNKKKKKKIFSKKKFRNVFCPQCAICDNRAQPKFCFNILYKSNPDLFTTSVFPNLVALSEGLMLSGGSAQSISLERFFQIFCSTGICAGTTCLKQEVCYTIFQEQAVGKPDKLAKAKIKKRKKKARKRQVYTPYATFFCRNDEKFKAKVNEILYGDNDNKQDKDQELSAGSTERTSGSAEGRQP